MGVLLCDVIWELRLRLDWDWGLGAVYDLRRCVWYSLGSGQ